MFGEAVVIPEHGFIPHFFTIIKQHGALLAKGHITGAQFDALFTDGLYEKIGISAIQAADEIRCALTEKGYSLTFNSPTNQIFVTVNKTQFERLSADVGLSVWEKTADEHIIIRLVTGWATTAEDTDRLKEIL